MFFPWKKALRRKSVWFSVITLLILGLTSVLAQVISPHDPYQWSLTAAQSNLPPVWVQNAAKAGVAEFPLGTDRYGRDILSRLLHGTRTAFLMAMTAVPLAAVIGTLFGLIAGYRSGWVDSMIMLIADMIQSLPGIMLVVIIILIFRNTLSPTWFHGLITLVVGFAAYSWVSLTRLVRANVLLLKSRPFIEAAYSLGASKPEIIFRHLLPNVFHVILIWVINNIPAVILLEAALGYIGVGITGAIDGSEFTVVSWGGMFFSGRSAIVSNPAMLIIPSLGILWMSISFILLANFINETQGVEK